WMMVAAVQQNKNPMRQLLRIGSFVLYYCRQRPTLPHRLPMQWRCLLLVAFAPRRAAPPPMGAHGQLCGRRSLPRAYKTKTRCDNYCASGLLFCITAGSDLLSHTGCPCSGVVYCSSHSLLAGRLRRRWARMGNGVDDGRCRERTKQRPDAITNAHRVFVFVLLPAATYSPT